MTLSPEAAAQLWATPIDTPAAPQPVDWSPTAGAAGPAPYRHYRPLEDAADEYISDARTLNTGDRLMTGIPVFDDAMRGISPKQMCMVVGFAHSGKTLVTTEIIRNNADKPLALFTMDEDRVLVLVKLVSMVTGEPAEALERAIANGDQAAEQMVRGVARESFPRLAVFDDVWTFDGMTRALGEAEDAWGAKCHGVFMDYLDLVQIPGQDGDGDTRAKATAAKAWGKATDVPFVVLHQSSRTGGADGATVTMTSGAYGGEQQATFIVGVRRKRDWYRAQIAEVESKLRTTSRNHESLREQLDELRAEAVHHQNTITCNLVKNKRPPSRLVDEIDFELEHRTGRITPLRSKAVPALDPMAAFRQHTPDQIATATAPYTEEMF